MCDHRFSMIVSAIRYSRQPFWRELRARHRRVIATPTVIVITLITAFANVSIDTFIARVPFFWNDWALLAALSLDLPLMYLLIASYDQFERDRRSGMLEQLSAAGIQPRHYYSSAADLVFALLCIVTVVQLALLASRDSDMRGMTMLISTFVASIALIYATLAMFFLFLVLRLPLWLTLASVWGFCAGITVAAVVIGERLYSANTITGSSVQFNRQIIAANWSAAAALPVFGGIFEAAAVWIDKSRHT